MAELTAPPMSTGPFALPGPAWTTAGAGGGRTAAGVPLRRLFTFPAIAIALRMIPGPSGDLAYLLITGNAFLGRRQAILSLFLLWLFNNATHAFARPPGLAALWRHAVVFAAAISVLILHVGARPRSRITGLLIATGALSLVLLAHSLLFSRVVDVSILKALSFALTIQTLLVAWSRLTASDREFVEAQIWGLLVALAFLSIPVFFTGAGFMRNKFGFQGLLYHPQMFGPTMAILCTKLVMEWLTRRRLNVAFLMSIAVCLAWVYLSRARIAAFDLILGLTAGFALGPLAKAVGRFGHASRVVKARLAFLGLLLAAAAIVAGPQLPAMLTDFLQKGSEAETLTDAALQSRGHKIDEMKANIAESPLTGIGLGVASNLEESRRTVRDPIFGLPVMATVEKGVLPVAMVEELGWPLALVYGCWFIVLFLMAARGGHTNIAVFMAALGTNVAEAGFFSPGGAGMLLMIMVAMTVTAAKAERASTGPWMGAAVRPSPA